LFRRIDRFFCIGSANRRLYQAYSVNDDRLYPAPYAVDNDRFAAQAECLKGQRAKLREEWKIPAAAFCILFCGKFIPKKRPFDVINAARVLIRNGSLPNLHLLFVGSGVLGGELRGACHVVWDAEKGGHVSTELCALDLPRATFTGFLNQTEISKAYVAADCLVLPSNYGETWGLVVNEAMATGLPTIVSSACGCAEDIQREFATKISFEMGNIDELTTVIKKFAEREHSTDDWKRKVKSFDLAKSLATVRAVYGANV
jgi:glycosyltransferase involved in cell wall biosynthesis